MQKVRCPLFLIFPQCNKWFCPPDPFYYCDWVVGSPPPPNTVQKFDWTSCMTFFQDSATRTMVATGNYVRAIGWLAQDWPFPKTRPAPASLNRLKQEKGPA